MTPVKCIINRIDPPDGPTPMVILEPNKSGSLYLRNLLLTFFRLRVTFRLVH